MLARLGSLPAASISGFRGPEDTLRLMTMHALGPHGEQSMLVRHFTTWVVGHVWPKDYLGEILAVRNVFVQPSPWRPPLPLFKYSNDPRHVEVVKHPERQVIEIFENGYTVVDCDEIALMAGTMLLQLGRQIEWVALGFRPGELTHVGVRCQEPKSGRWIWIDAVAGPREADAARAATNVLIWGVN